MDLAKLLEAIRKRQATGKGIGLAVYYLKTAEPFLGSLPMGSEWQYKRALKEAENLLVYRSEDATAKLDLKSIKELSEDDKAKTCMVFENVLTSSKEDRDSDILMPKGAEIDPLMPLLWQHMPMMPVGKYLGVVKRDDSMIKTMCAIADTEFGRDVAQMVDFGALRISHGFAPKEFEPREDKDGKPAMGWKILKYEVMEVSLVSIPSNTDAVITAYSRQKLHSPYMKQWAKSEWDRLPQSARMSLENKTEGNGPVVVVINDNKSTSGGEGVKRLRYSDLIQKAKKEKAKPKKDHVAKDEEETGKTLEEVRDDLQKILDDCDDEDTAKVLTEQIAKLSEMIGEQADKDDEEEEDEEEEKSEEDDEEEETDEEEKDEDTEDEEDDEEDDKDDEDADLVETGADEETEPDEDEEEQTDKDDEEEEEDDKDDQLDADEEREEEDEADEEEEGKEDEEDEDDEEEKSEEDDDEETDEEEKAESEEEEEETDEEEKEEGDDEEEEEEEPKEKACAMCGGRMKEGMCEDCGGEEAKEVGDDNGDLDEDDPEHMLDKPKGFSVPARDMAWMLIAQLTEGKRVRIETLRQVLKLARRAAKREVRIKEQRMF